MFLMSDISGVSDQIVTFTPKLTLAFILDADKVHKHKKTGTQAINTKIAKAAKSKIYSDKEGQIKKYAKFVKHAKC